MKKFLLCFYALLVIAKVFAHLPMSDAWHVAFVSECQPVCEAFMDKEYELFVGESDNEDATKLIIEYTDETKDSFSFNTQPKLSFNGLLFRVTYIEDDSYCDLEMPRSYVKRFYFESPNHSDAIGQIEAGVHTYFVAPGKIKVSGAAVGDIHVYDIGGKGVPASIEPCADGTVVVSLQRLPKGIYIIRYGKTSIKISI